MSENSAVGLLRRVASAGEASLVRRRAKSVCTPRVVAPAVALQVVVWTIGLLLQYVPFL